MLPNVNDTMTVLSGCPSLTTLWVQLILSFIQCSCNTDELTLPFSCKNRLLNQIANKDDECWQRDNRPPHCTLHLSCTHCSATLALQAGLSGFELLWGN